MIFFKKCPCCKKRIFAWNSRVCKYIENYKCYYCPKCRHQISNPKKVKKENMSLNILISLIVIIGVSSLSEKTNIFVLILWMIFILLVTSLFFTFLHGLFIPLICIEDEGGEEIERTNSDLFGSDMPFMKMDSIEKENYHQKIDFVVGIGGYGLLIFIILGVMVSLIRYFFG